MVTTSNADKTVEKLGHSYTTTEKANWYRLSGKHFLKKPKHATVITIQSCITGHSSSQRNENLCSHENLYGNVYDSFIFNIPQMK